MKFHTNKQIPNSVVSKEGATPAFEADDPLIDMKFMTTHSGLSDKWFYKLIQEKKFTAPIKLGRSSRWRRSDYFHWLESRTDKHSI